VKARCGQQSDADASKQEAGGYQTHSLETASVIAMLFGPTYARDELAAMDARFRRQMKAAIKRGDETCAPSVSTAPCTKRPIVVRPE